MRICFIGALSSVHTRRWVTFFSSRGHDVHVISTSIEPDEPIDGLVIHPFQVHRTRSYGLNLLLSAMSLPFKVIALRRLVKTIKPDIVHVHYINEMALYAVLTGFQTVVLTAWGSDVVVSAQQSRIRRRTVAYALRHAMLITCDADHMAEHIEHLGVPRDRIHVVFFGTDVEHYTPDKRDAVWREQIAKRCNPVIVSTRHLEPVYDIESQVRAMPRVAERFPSVKLLIGGAGSLRNDLERLASELGVADRVELIGAISQTDMPRLLASADAYVSTALSDGGIAASTAEAMACGVPVVITDVGNNRQWVTDGGAGYLVPVSAPEAIADRLVAILSDQAAARQMGEAGRATIEQRNNLHLEMSRMERLYRLATASDETVVAGI